MIVYSAKNGGFAGTDDLEVISGFALQDGRIYLTFRVHSENAPYLETYFDDKETALKYVRYVISNLLITNVEELPQKVQQVFLPDRRRH